QGGQPRGVTPHPEPLPVFPLADWLVDRRHCNLKWQSQVLVIREKINVAIQDMPENQEIKQLLEGAYLHYFHCLRIVEILKGTEASTKNLFGRYSSQRMKDWQEIVSLYEKENTYLAELASLLVRSISYEIPSLRRQLGRCQQAQQELARREEECQLGAAELRERFLASCKQYGITVSPPGVPPCHLLPQSSPLLTPAFGLSGLQPALRVPYLSSIRGLIRGGRCWLLIYSSMQTGWERWGCSAWRREGSRETLEHLPQDEGIDWGDGDSEGVQITVLEAGTEVPEGVACGSDALTLLENTETRNQFIDELMELELFLSQRLVGMEEEADVVAVSQFQLAPPVLQGQTSARVGSLLGSTRALLGQLCTRSMQHLFIILASPR
ncbi:CK5P3 protein, partial [Hemiprocne comata]|nr:CK5P3 protein [Hemiprocne comata]